MRALALSTLLTVLFSACGSSHDFGEPAVGEHWHAAYGVFVCDSFLRPIADQSGSEGIHSHGDGLIHIHPFVDSSAGKNANIGKFFSAVQIDITDQGLFGPGGSIEEGLVCADGPAEFKIARWTLAGVDLSPEIIDEDLARVRFREDLEIFTLGFVAPGNDLPVPPSIGKLRSISEVDLEVSPK